MSSLPEVFAWCLWNAMQAGVRDVVFEESVRGLTVKHFVEGKHASRSVYHEVMCFPHLRGSPLRGLPAKGAGTAVNECGRWKLRFWTGLKAVSEESPACTLVQLVPMAIA